MLALVDVNLWSGFFRWPKKEEGQKVQCFSKRKKDEQNTAWNRMEKGEPATSLMKTFS